MAIGDGDRPGRREVERRIARVRGIHQRQADVDGADQASILCPGKILSMRGRTPWESVISPRSRPTKWMSHASGLRVPSSRQASIASSPR